MDLDSHSGSDTHGQRSVSHNTKAIATAERAERSGASELLQSRSPTASIPHIFGLRGRGRAGLPTRRPTQLWRPEVCILHDTVCHVEHRSNTRPTYTFLLVTPA